MLAVFINTTDFESLRRCNILFASLISPRQQGLCLPAYYGIDYGADTEPSDYSTEHFRVKPLTRLRIPAEAHADLDLWPSIQVLRVRCRPGPPLGPSQPIKSLPFMTIPAVFTPLPTTSQAVSHLAGKKTLARFWYTGLATSSHRAPFHHIHPPCCLCFLLNPVPNPFVSKKARSKGIGSFFARLLDNQDKSTNHQRPSPALREHELFTKLDDCGRINPTTCRTNLPGMPAPEQPSRGRTRHGSGCASSLPFNRTRLTCCLL